MFSHIKLTKCFTILDAKKVERFLPLQLASTTCTPIDLNSPITCNNTHTNSKIKEQQNPSMCDMKIIFTEQYFMIFINNRSITPHRISNSTIIVYFILNHIKSLPKIKTKQS